MTAEYTYYGNNKVHTLYNKKGSQIISAFVYAYDEEGNLEGEQGASGTKVYSYTALGQLETAGSLSGRQAAYEYDGSGNREKATVSGQGAPEVIEYVVDERNRLSRTERALPGAHRVDRYSYDHAGNALLRMPESVGQSNGASGKVSLGFPGHSEADDLWPSLYRYDTRNRMIHAVGGGGAVTSSYDAEGQRVQCVRVEPIIP